ncbi:MAG: hypothetical protein ACJ76F_05160 [Bacteroidia bacterium]
MFRSIKISTALLICATFMFRLLFVNVGIVSANTRQNNAFMKAQFSSLMKRRKSDNTLNTSSAREYSVIEICEEDFNDEDKLSKTNPLILVGVLNSFLINKVASLKSNILFDFLNCKYPSRKYLAISVLRI